MLNIVGNDNAKNYIKQVLENGNLASSYIITGEEDTGQAILAMEFAKALMCESNFDKPCHKCRHCIAFENNSNMDLFILDYKDALSIGVDDIRQKIEQSISIKPISSDRKIYIILDAEKMTVQAQNSLLKTLEEPPFYAIFFLVTSAYEQLLPTIRSRCVKIETVCLDDDLIRENLLQKYELSDRDLNFITAFSFGKIERAYKLAQNDEIYIIYEKTVVLLKCFVEDFFDKLLFEIDNFSKQNLNINDCLNLIKVWFRDVMIFKATKDPNLLIFKDKLKEIKKYANSCSYEGIEDIIMAIDKANVRLKAKVSKELVLELLRENIISNMNI